jgi:hypothetical protein
MGDVTITRTKGKLGRRKASEDNYAGLLMSGVAATGIVLSTVYELNKLADAENLGIDAAYDFDNTMLAHYHISEFFRMCPEGKLFIMLVDQNVSMTQMADKALAYAAKLLRDPLCQGKIRTLGIGRNPATGYTPTIAGGLDNDVALDTAGVYTGAVVKAQALATEEESLHRPVLILLEGRSFNGTSAAAIDLTLADAPQVAVVIAADLDINNLDALYYGSAAVGTGLGIIAHRKVNENIGWVSDGNIQDQGESAFLTPGLSSKLVLNTYTDGANGDLKVLHDKGFLVLKTYIGADGVYFYGDRTCVDASDDYATLSNNRVVQKAMRKAYARLLPHVNSSVQVESATGTLKPSVCNYFEQEVISELKSMVTDGEISGVNAFVDPDQNIIQAQDLKVDIEIIPTGTAESIKVSLGFNNPA